MTIRALGALGAIATSAAVTYAFKPTINNKVTHLADGVIEGHAEPKNQTLESLKTLKPQDFDRLTYDPPKAVSASLNPSIAGVALEYCLVGAPFVVAIATGILLNQFKAPFSNETEFDDTDTADVEKR
jgi:hypothetical protein